MKKRFLAATALLSSGLLHAQADTTSTPLNEVIVTANKFAQKQASTGKVISVISKEQIEKSGGRTLGQLLNEQAGISINGALNNLGSNQTVYMRGASSGRTLVLIDGIPAYDPSLINSEFDLNLISLNNVERVEISRGAQSTLYGSDAVAGVINVITARKDFEKPFNVNATLSAGNFNTYRGNVQVYGKKDKLSYTARYGKLKSSGFSAAYDNNTVKQNFDNDNYNSDVASGMVQFQTRKDLLLKSFVQYSKYRTELDAGLFKDEKDYEVKNNNLMAGAGFKYNKANLTITGNYQYSDINRNYFNDSLDTPGFTKFATDDYFGKNQFIEVYSNVVLSKNFTLLQGADYRFSSMRSKYYSLSSFGPYTDAFKDTSHSQASLYGSLFYKGFQEKLNVELGGRLNVHSRYGSNSTFTFNPSFNLNNHFRVFGSIATAFKAPTLYQLYSSYGRQDLKPEESKTYEAGVQSTFSKIQSRVVLFNRSSDNGIDFNYITYQYFNFIKQKVKGIEVETSVQPIKGLNISANYTFLKPTEQTQSRVTYNDTTYAHLLRRPEHSINASVGYQASNAFYISATGKYVSSRYDVGGYQTQDVLLDDYFIVNAYAEYKLKHFVKLFADAQNITNRKFFEARGFNAIPFLINVGATFNW